MAGKEFPLSLVIRAVDQATKDLRKVDQQIAKIGDRVAKVGRAMTVGFTVPIVAAGAASIRAFSEFETGLANVSTLIDTSAESIDDIGDRVREVGARVPVAYGNLTSALYDVRSAGVAASDQFIVLEKAAQLGVAGLGTTKEAVDLVTSSMNAFGLQGADADRVYDSIFKTVKSGKTTISELAQGFGAVAGTVAATGTELDEYLASVAALTTTGLPAAQAHTQLRAVISGLTRETSKSRKVFRQLGARDFKDLIAQSGGLVPAIQRIAESLGGNEARMLELVGSTEALNAILSLSGAQADVFASTLAGMRDGSDAVTEAFEKQAATTAASMQRARNAAARAGQAVGKILAPALEQVARYLERAAAWFDTLDENTKRWVVDIAVVVAALGPAITILGNLTKALAVLRTAFTLITTATRIMTASMLLNPIVLIIAAIAAGALLIIKYWDPISAWFAKMWDRVRPTFMRFASFVKRLFMSNLSPVGLIIRHWDKLEPFFAGMWEGIKGIFSGALSFLEWQMEAFLAMVDGVLSAAEWLEEAVGGGPEGTGASTGLGTVFERAGLDQIVGGGQVASNSKVTVEFANAPRGTRVASESNGAQDVDLSVGYQLEVGQ